MSALTSAALASAVDTILRPQLDGSVLVRGDDRMTAETGGFNVLTAHDPDVAVSVASEADVVAAVRFAVQHQLPVSIQCTGHGTYTSVTGGMLLLTRRLNTLVIDPATRTATIGAGLDWAAVITASAEHGLAPLTGSSPHVGAVGFTLGGGLGPLSRSFGFAADWVRSFRVVTADGRAVTADATQNRELFWSLRGGKGGLGVVTEMQLELIPLETLYGGGLFFGADDIEAALRAWVDWTGSAPQSLTSSVAVLRMPDLEEIPAQLRGKVLLHVRYAYVGEPGQSAAESASEGERLLAPLRAAAPVYLDLIGELPAGAVGQIHNDPDQPMPVWDRGMSLSSIDQDFVSALLPLVGPAADVPFILVEIRHLGGACLNEPDGGNAVGGRSCGYTFTLIGAPAPELFEHTLPALADRIAEAITPWLHAETNINFAGKIQSAKHFASSWSAAPFDRLARARATFDPDRVFAYAPVG